MTDPLAHEANHHQIHHRQTGQRHQFIIFAQSSELTEPSKSPLYYPPLCLDYKTALLSSFHCLYFHPVLLRPEPHILSTVPLIHYHLCWNFLPFGSKKEKGLQAISLGTVGGSYYGRYQQSKVINQNMSFPTFNFFASIKPTEPFFSVVFTL